MNFLSNLFGGVKNIFGGAAQGAGNLLGSLGKSTSNGIGGLMSLFGGGGQAQMPAMKPASVPGISNPGMSLGMPGVSGMSSATPGFINNISPDKKKSFLDSIFPGGATQGAVGLAMPMVGDMFAPKTPNIPDFTGLDSVKALQGFRPGNSVSPEYQNMLQRNNAQLREQKVRELQALYHNARPGTDYLNDSNYQRDLAKIDQDLQTNMADDLARAEATFSQQEMARLSQIAEMDIYSIMAQTGMKAQEAQQFKEMFSNMGNTLLTNATRDNSNDQIMKQFMMKQLGIPYGV